MSDTANGKKGGLNLEAGGRGWGEGRMEEVGKEGSTVFSMYCTRQGAGEKAEQQRKGQKLPRLCVCVCVKKKALV